MKRIFSPVKIILSVVFLILVLGNLDIKEILMLIKNLRPGYAIACFVWSFFMIMASCIKWYLCLYIQGLKISFIKLYKIYLVGYFFSNIMPSNVGGDVVRAFFVGRQKNAYAKAMSSVFVERFSGLLILLILVVMTWILKKEFRSDGRVFIPAFIAFAGLLLCIYLTLIGFRHSKGVLYDVMERILKRLSGRGIVAKIVSKIIVSFLRFVDQVKYACQVIKANPVYGVYMILLTLLFYIMVVINVYLAFLSFNIVPSITGIIRGVSIVMFIAMIPVPMGSLGLVEGAYYCYADIIGVSSTASTMMGLLLRLKMVFIGTIGGIIYLAMKENIDKGVMCDGDNRRGTQ